MNVVIVYHTKTKNVACFDGLCAATLLWGEFGFNAEYIPAMYCMSSDEPALTPFVDKRVYFVDFSYSLEVMDKIAAVADFLLVVDSTIDESVQRSYLTRNREASASLLVWRYLNGSKPYPRFIDLIDKGARFVEDPELDAFNAALSVELSDFPTWHALMTSSVQSGADFCDLLERGRILCKYRNRNTAILVAEAFQITCGGQTGLAVNANKFYSHQVAVELARQSKTFGAAFFLRYDGQVEVSLRRTDSDLDLSKIAAMYGGGGSSPGAAAFAVSIEKFRELMHLETRPQLLARLDAVTKAFPVNSRPYINVRSSSSDLLSYLRSEFGSAVVESLHVSVEESVVHPSVTQRCLARLALWLGLPRVLHALSWYHTLFPYREYQSFVFDEAAIREVLLESRAGSVNPSVGSFLVDTLIGTVNSKTLYELPESTYYLHVTILMAGCRVPVKHTFKVFK